MSDFLSPDDFGALSRATKALEAATESRDYLLTRLWAKYNISPRGRIMDDGSIEREPPPEESSNGDSAAPA